MSIYKAYDIRGIYPSELDEAIAYKVGRAFATLMRKEQKRADEVRLVVARDMRTSGESLTDKVIAGLRDAGASVVYCGLTATPTFYFAVARYGYDGGIMVSASHNPKQYNGFKMVRRHAAPLSYETGIAEIERMVTTDDLGPKMATGTYSEKEGVLDDQIAHDLRYGDIRHIAPFKVVADAANGMGALYLQALFAKLPCDLIPMNFELDGTFPAHEADPLKEENLKDLQKRVIRERADIGISTDGDGDRIFFVDNMGKTVEPGIVRGILATLFLADRPGSKIGYDVRPARITRDMILAAGGVPVVTRVGHSLIKSQMKHDNLYFAGESSGHFYLNMLHGCYEVPVIVILKLLAELTQSKKTLAQYIAPLQKYAHSGEINTRVTDIPTVIEAIAQKYSDGKQDRLDGVSIEYPNYWFNVRGSNTEPLIRLNLEATSEKLMEEKRNEVLGLIRGFALK